MRGIAALLALPAVVTAGLVASVPLVANSTDSAGSCSLTVAEQRVESLSPEQVANARIIVGAAASLALPERAAVIAVATAQQESRLRNLAHGDRDSLGLFQQRPSAGWGTPRQILDPVYASRQFYAHLARVPGWESLPLTVAAQTVQRSAFPDAYAKWETLAARTVAALSGADPTALVCQVDDDPSLNGAATNTPAPAWPPEHSDGSGLTPRTRAAMDAVRAAFGVTNIGGYCPGGCRDGHIAGSDHYTGHAIDVMLTPINDSNRILGDSIANWLVANADRLAVKYVIWNERIWSRGRAGEGWRPYRHPSGSTNATLAHRDHVHLSIW